MKTDIAQKFWSRVDKTGDCWVWTGEKNNKGYGRVSVGRMNRRRFLAHRLSLELNGSTLAKTDCVIHSCDNPACVNPAHLSVGSQADNLADMRSKKRHNIGERNGLATTSIEQVRMIRSLIGVIGPTEIAERCGVSRSVVQHIKSGKRWSQVQ